MKLLVILGTTSTGKTDIALQLAKKFNGELVSCDSRQVYKDLDIGTGKEPGSKSLIKKGEKFWEVNGIKIWMYDVVDPKKQYSVFDYVKETKKILENIRKRGKLPIIVGGTGLYLRALLYGLPNLDIPIDKKLRRKLQKLSLQELQKKLQELSPKKWESINYSDRQNPRRLTRAIEMVILNPKSEGSFRAMGDSSATPQNDKNATRNDILKIGLFAPREILYQRIDERVRSRIDQGMLNEAKKLNKSGLSLKRMRELGLEYGVLADYLEGKITNIPELIKVLQGKIHGYARRQITWFKKEKSINWFDLKDEKFIQKVEEFTSQWYYKDTEELDFSLEKNK